MASLPRSVQAIFPGETARLEYRFFRNREESGQFDFGDQDGRFWANAWLASQLALLAYADGSTIETAIDAAGLELSAPLIEVGEHRDLLAFVCRSGQTLFVVFRGTLFPAPSWPIDFSDFQKAMENWETNLDAALVEAGDNARGLVHQGFQSAWIGLLESELTPLLDRVDDAKRIVWIGHSLGAAIATVAARMYANPKGWAQQIVSFGSPRVGDAQFVEDHHTPHWRFVLGSDLVTLVPPSVPREIVGGQGYRHHGTKVSLSYKQIVFNVDEVWRLIDEQIGLDAHQKSADLGLLELVPTGLRDHAMLLYTAKCQQIMRANVNRL